MVALTNFSFKLKGLNLFNYNLSTTQKAYIFGLHFSQKSFFIVIEDGKYQQSRRVNFRDPKAVEKSLHRTSVRNL